MLSIWLNVQGYISNTSKSTSPIRGSVTASVFGSLEVQAPVSSLSFFPPCKSKLLSLLKLQSIMVVETQPVDELNDVKGIYHSFSIKNSVDRVCLQDRQQFNKFAKHFQEDSQLRENYSTITIIDKAKESVFLSHEMCFFVLFNFKLDMFGLFLGWQNRISSEGNFTGLFLTFYRLIDWGKTFLFLSPSSFWDEIHTYLSIH